MRFLDKFRQNPAEKIDSIFYHALPRKGRQTVFEDAIHASASAAIHTANRVVGPVTTSDQRTNYDTNFGDWLETIEDAQKLASVGIHVGYIVGNRLLKDLSPSEVLAINIPECDRGLE